MDDAFYLAKNSKRASCFSELNFDVRAILRQVCFVKNGGQSLWGMALIDILSCI